MSEENLDSRGTAGNSELPAGGEKTGSSEAPRKLGFDARVRELLKGRRTWRYRVYECDETLPAVIRLNVLMDRQRQDAEDFMLWSREVWEKDDNGFLVMAAWFPNDQVSNKYLTKLKKHRDLLHQLALYADERAEETQRAYDRLKAIADSNVFQREEGEVIGAESELANVVVTQPEEEPPLN